MLEEDHPLPWRTRIKIYAITVGIGLLVILAWWFVNLFLCLPLQQKVTLGIAFFGFIVSIGHLIVKTHDIKKQFKDSYSQRAQQQLNTALGLLYDNEENVKARLAGMRLLSQLAQDPNYVDKNDIKESFLLRIDLKGAELSM